MGIIKSSTITYKDKMVIRILFALWTISTANFYLWWTLPQHTENIIGFSLISLGIFWFSFLSLYNFITLLKIKNNTKVPINPNWKIAMVVTKAPSEPLSIVQKTLRAAISMKEDHDTWVADEDPTPEALKWYKDNSIKVSTRKGVAEYHNEIWPRRTKCKEGNLAYFYDKYGYDNYDFVIQLDSDHVPQKDYLKEMLSHFTDDSVGYVAAPSICNKNQQVSWASRARMHSESVFHGPMQAGSNAPVCIGSHYAVRTKALKEIGGLGPDLAEDFSTTVMMNSKGWRGAWAYNAEAIGDGPSTFTDLIIQDYQWSKSLVTLLITFFGKHWRNLSWKKRFQFLISQIWYPTNALLWIISISIPFFAVLLNKSPVETKFTDFGLLFGMPFIVSFITFFYIRSRRLLRPHVVKIFSWENMLFEAARWPWVLVSCFDAIYSVITKKKTTFRVTPKGSGSARNISFRIFFPYILISIIGIATTGYGIFTGTNLYGYLIMCSMITVFYSLLISITLFLHIQENYEIQLWSLTNFRLQTN